MRIAACIVTALLAGVCSARQPRDIADRAKRIVPKVGVSNDADFFAAWDLDYPGMEAVKDAVHAGDLPKAKIALKEYFLQRRKPKWRLNYWDMPAKPKGKAEEHSKYQQGEDVLAHKFSGHDFGDKIDWNCFPIKKPDGTPDTEFSPSPVTFRHASTVLGQLYWFSHDEKYAKEFADEIIDFVTSYPAPEKPARYPPCMWSKLRSISPLCGTWFDAYNFFLPSKSFTPEAHAAMLRGFIEKARFAVRNPDSVNRYLVQLRGIYALGCYFPELKQAKDIREFALAAMRAGVEEEFYPDTASKELCPGYQGMYVSALYGFVENSQVMGYDPPEDLRKALESCCDFYTYLLTPSRQLPCFGDTPHKLRPAKVFRLNVVPLVDKPVFRWMASEGKEGKPPEFRSTRLPWAGFYVMRSGWDEKALYLCMDAGPLGKGHWHEDFGNFECYAFGERLIADMGTYSYTFSEWRQYFVSSLAHNVVLVDRLSQNRAADLGDTWLTDQPRSNDWHSDDVFDLAWGTYSSRWGDYRDGNHWFKRHGRDKAVQLATHRRDICFVKDSYWIISDRLEAKGDHTYSQLFHFEPDRTVKVVADGRAGTFDPERPNILIAQADSVPARVIKGQKDPLQGWFSAGKFDHLPAPVLSFDQSAADRVRYDTVLFPLEKGQQSQIKVQRVSVTNDAREPVSPQEVCALRITTDEGTDYYINDMRQKQVGPPNGQAKIIGPVETDARAAVIRLSRDGRVLRVSAVGASYIRMDGKAIWPD